MGLFLELYRTLLFPFNLSKSGTGGLSALLCPLTYLDVNIRDLHVDPSPGRNTCLSQHLSSQLPFIQMVGSEQPFLFCQAYRFVLIRIQRLGTNFAKLLGVSFVRSIG